MRILKERICEEFCFDIVIVYALEKKRQILNSDYYFLLHFVAIILCGCNNLITESFFVADYCERSYKRNILLGDKKYGCHVLKVLPQILRAVAQ